MLPKIHRALGVAGHFLVWRQVFGDPEAPITPFRERVAEIVRRRGEPQEWMATEDVAAMAERLSRSGLFVVHDVFTCRWSVQLDARQIHELFATFSNWSGDEAAEAGDAVRRFGGAVTEHYSSWLIDLRPARPNER